MIEFTNLVISASGFLIVMLLGIIGFFLKRQIVVIESLTESVNALKTSMEIVRNNESNFKLSCGLKHGTIDKRLDSHGDRLDQHETAIKLLEAQKPRKPRKNEAN